MTEKSVAFNSTHVQGVEIDSHKCEITFAKYTTGQFGTYRGTHIYYKGAKEFEECVRIYHKLKVQR